MIRGYAAAGRIVVMGHALTRMRQRGVRYADLRCALVNAAHCAASTKGRWKTSGYDVDGDVLTCVVAIEAGCGGRHGLLKRHVMKRCIACGNNTLNSRPLAHTIELGARIFESEVKGWLCGTCGKKFFDGRTIERFERNVAKWLIEQGYENSAELRFLRRVAGIRAADLAALLGVSAETVSHWETGKHAVDVATRNTVASLVLDALRGSDTAQTRLRAMRAPAKTKRVRLGTGRAA